MLTVGWVCGFVWGGKLRGVGLFVCWWTFERGALVVLRWFFWVGIGFDCCFGVLVLFWGWLFSFCGSFGLIWWVGRLLDSFGF